MTLIQCFNCGEPVDVVDAYMVVPYVSEKYGWYCNQECYEEDRLRKEQQGVGETDSRSDG